MDVLIVNVNYDPLNVCLEYNRAYAFDLPGDRYWACIH